MGSMFGTAGGKPVDGKNLEVIFFDEEDSANIRKIAQSLDSGARFTAAKAVVMRTIATQVGREWDNKTGRLVRRSLDEVDMGGISLSDGKEAFDNTLSIIREAYYAWFGVAEQPDDYEEVGYGAAKQIIKAAKVAATSPLPAVVEKAQIVVEEALKAGTNKDIKSVIDKAYPGPKPSPETIGTSLYKSLVEKRQATDLVEQLADNVSSKFRVDEKAKAKLVELRDTLNAVSSSLTKYLDWHDSTKVAQPPASTENATVVPAGTEPVVV